MSIPFDQIKKKPKSLPKGLLQFIRDVILPDDNVITYDRDHPKNGYCYACGSPVRAPGRRFSVNNGHIKCPKCGTECWQVLSDGITYASSYITNVATLQKGPDGCVWIREWHVWRAPEKGVKKSQLEEIEAWALMDGDAAKWTMESRVAYTMMNYERVRSADWEKSKSTVYTLDGFYSFYLPPDWREIVAGTPLQYLDLEAASRRIKYTNVIRLMLDWMRYPAVEKLQKAGFTGLINEKLAGRDSPRSIKWKQRDIEAALGFPLRLVSKDPAARAVLTLEQAALLKKVWGYSLEGRIKETEVLPLYEFFKDRYMVGEGVKILKSIETPLSHASVNKVLRYLSPEYINKIKPEVYSRGISRQRVDTYRDYINDCVALGLDLDDHSVLFPKDLDRAHQRTIELVKYEENKAYRKKMKKRAKALEAMSFASGALLIRPAASESELTKEGKTLHHCVAGYAKRMAEGKTAIFFI